MSALAQPWVYWGLFAVGAILFLQAERIGQSIRRLRQVEELKITEWKRPLAAVEEFADARLLEMKDKSENRFGNWIDGQVNSERAISDLNKRLSGGEDVSEKLHIEKRRLDTYIRMARSEENELQRLWASIRENMGRMLAEGTLVSKGVAIPHTPNKEEMRIPEYEWRIMEISPREEMAVGKADGEIKYIGIVIGRAH